MPLSEYFKGDGRKIMAEFVRRYGERKGKRMFYATANKKGLAPRKKRKRQMDSRSVASAAVRKNLGPDPSMGRKVELLRRLVSMRQADGRRDPKATTNPPRRGMIVDRFDRVRSPQGGGRLPNIPGREKRGVPTRLPRRDQMPARFAGRPGYNFGPPRGM